MVSRDYKRNRARRESFSGWTGLFIGLIIGLGVGLALYFFDSRTPAPLDKMTFALHISAWGQVYPAGKSKHADRILYTLPVAMTLRL